MHKERPRKILVGLTGGIGTGKSSALDAFRRCRAETVSADEIAHRLSRRGGVLFEAIVRGFGRKFIGAGGELDRRALAEKVFKNPPLRRRLERATHPAILREMRRRISVSRRPVVVADVPLLFEAGAEKDFDLTVVVSATPQLSIERTMRRDQTARAEVLRRMRAQMPIKRKEALADVVIDNTGTRFDLEKKVREYYRAFELMAHAKIRRK